VAPPLVDDADGAASAVETPLAVTANAKAIKAPAAKIE
jgi:hypothetical protein